MGMASEPNGRASTRSLPETADTSSPAPSSDPVAGAEGARRLIAAGQAALSMFIANVYDRTLGESEGRSDVALDHALRSAAAELAVALRRPPQSLLAEMERAHALVTAFPATQRAWLEGRIDQGHARAIQRHGSPIESEDRRARYEEILLEEAPQLTPRQLDARARALAAEAREQSAEERHGEAARERRVIVQDEAEGMSWLMALLPSWQAHAIHDRLTEHAKGLREADRRAREADSAAVPDARSFDALRADSLADLLLAAESQQLAQAFGGEAPRIQAKVAVQVPVMTLLGRSDEPAELLGVGPVPLATVREIAAEEPAFERVLVDPVRQIPVAVETYQPSAALRRTLAARDRTCRFPGCRRPAAHSDLDHTQDWARGGSTSVGNLAHLCRGHHTIKHQTPWKVRQLGGGRLEWTTPGGRVVGTAPPRIGPWFERDPDPDDDRPHQTSERQTSGEPPPF